MASVQTRGFVEPDAPRLEVIRSCVHCGFCLPACPTYRLTGRERSSPRGRIWLMKAVAEGKLDLLDPIFEDEMYFCLNCRACEAVCPSGVLYGEIVEASRAQIERARPDSAKARAIKRLTYGFLFDDMRRLRAVSVLGRLYQRTGMRTLVQRSGVLRLLGLESSERMMPEISDHFTVPMGQTWPAQGELRGRVALFTGCIMSTAFASVHDATVRVLTRNGFEVTAVADQGCCGALHVHGGDFDGGRRLARRNIDRFKLDRFDAIILNSAGCGAAMKEYGHLLSNDPDYAERASEFSAKVKDVIEFLADRGLVAEPGALNMRVTYQEPCHLAHAQRITREPRDLLNAIPGLELVEMADSSLCCGSAGIYNLIQPDASQSLLELKLDNALATKPDLIVSANPGCMLQLGAGLRARGDGREVVHLIDLLDRAYARAESGARAVGSPAGVVA